MIMTVVIVLFLAFGIILYRCLNVIQFTSLCVGLSRLSLLCLLSVSRFAMSLCHVSFPSLHLNSRMFPPSYYSKALVASVICVLVSISLLSLFKASSYSPVLSSQGAMLVRKHVLVSLICDSYRLGSVV